MKKPRYSMLSCEHGRVNEAVCIGSAKDPLINVKSRVGEETHGTSLIPADVLDTEGFLVIGSHCLHFYSNRDHY